MSIDSLKWAARIRSARGLSESALRTLAILADYERAGICWPKVARLMADRGVTRGTVYAHLHELETAKLIERAVDVELSHLPMNRRPVVWRLNYPSALGSDIPDPKGAEACPQGSDPLDPIALRGPTRGPTRRTVGVRTDRNAIEEEPQEEPEEGGDVAVESEAWADLGGGTPTPIATTVKAKTFPRQCEKHQAGENVTPCLACRASREKAETADLEVITRARREADTQRADRLRAQAADIRACPLCNDAGRLPGGAVCSHQESVPMPASLKAEALEAIHEAQAHRVTTSEATA